MKSCHTFFIELRSARPAFELSKLSFFLVVPVTDLLAFSFPIRVEHDVDLQRKADPNSTQFATARLISH